MSEKEFIANNIKRLVDLKSKFTGKSIVQIADEAGISRTILYAYISGESAPIVFNLKKLCKALDCTYEDILGKID